MAKLGALALIIIGVIGCYVIMMAIQPATNLLVETANASGNWTSYPETQAAINGFPLYSWFIPGILGVAAFIGILRGK